MDVSDGERDRDPAALTSVCVGERLKKDEEKAEKKDETPKTDSNDFSFRLSNKSCDFFLRL